MQTREESENIRIGILPPGQSRVAPIRAAAPNVLEHPRPMGRAQTAGRKTRQYASGRPPIATHQFGSAKQLRENYETNGSAIGYRVAGRYRQTSCLRSVARPISAPRFSSGNRKSPPVWFWRQSNLSEPTTVRMMEFVEVRRCHALSLWNHHRNLAGARGNLGLGSLWGASRCRHRLAPAERTHDRSNRAQCPRRPRNAQGSGSGSQ